MNTYKCNTYENSLEKALLVKAKINLYNLILRKPLEKITRNEASIAYQLSGDPDVQAVLEKKIKAGVEEEQE